MLVPVNVELVARDAYKAHKRGDLIIVIDVVRATTSIITALANGAKSVTPVETLKEARQLRKQHNGYLLAGERNGVKPRGFDLDNSPLSLTKDKVEGKNIIMSTTNGTNALVRSGGSKWVIVAALVNATAVARESLKIASRNQVGISIVLAGQKNQFALEDFVCAGGIIEKFSRDAVELSDRALGALLAFNGSKQNLQDNIRKSKHSQELLKIGFSKDIEFACQIDLYELVPFFRNGRVNLFACPSSEA